MAACEPQGESPPSKEPQFHSRSALIDRLEEEISRALRQGTPLGALLLGLDGRREFERTHGPRLTAELVSYSSHALLHGFRRFDRLGDAGEGDFLALLPGADAAATELVARRVLQRLRAIKIEVRGARQPVRVYAAITHWREGQTAAQLIAEVRAAATRERLGFRDAVRI